MTKAPHRPVTDANDGKFPPTARWEPDRPPSQKTMLKRVRYNKLSHREIESSDVAEEEEYLYDQEEERREEHEQTWTEATQDEAEEYFATREHWKGR